MEVISENQVNELDILFKKKQLINKHHNGLMGLIVSYMIKRNDLAIQAVAQYTQSTMEVVETAGTEKLR